MKVADHKEALAILSVMARDGKVAAAIALERALRSNDYGTTLDDELDRIIRG